MCSSDLVDPFVPGSPGIDFDDDTLRFVTPHEFETGFIVLYEATGDVIDGLVDDTEYGVVSIDANTIQLKDLISDTVVDLVVPATPPATAQIQTLTLVAPTDTINVANHGFSGGEALTYRAPVFGTFASQDVNLLTDTIGVADHTLSTGDEVVYRTDSSESIGSLTEGDTYFVIVGVGDDIQLADSFANASVGIAIDLTSVKPFGVHSLGGEAIPELEIGRAHV